MEPPRGPSRGPRARAVGRPLRRAIEPARRLERHGGGGRAGGSGGAVVPLLPPRVTRERPALPRNLKGHRPDPLRHSAANLNAALFAAAGRCERRRLAPPARRSSLKRFQKLGEVFRAAGATGRVRGGGIKACAERSRATDSDQSVA